MRTDYSDNAFCGRERHIGASRRLCRILYRRISTERRLEIESSGRFVDGTAGGEYKKAGECRQEDGSIYS